MRDFLLTHWCWVFLYLGAASLWAFCLMGFDKRRAKNGGWRVRERTFFLAALLGGSLGAVLGMYAFRHKTKHWYFKWGLPAILVVQAALAVWLLLPSTTWLPRWGELAR